MNSLYSRLFRYKARPEREPLEDFLSEALADLLGRMDANDLTNFLNWAFEAARDKPDWSSLSRKKVEWVTQFHVPGGIADTVLFLDGKPALIIENKTWSPFQDHSTDEFEATQVTTYCKWLRESANPLGICGVLLITGTNEAPDGYHGNGDFAVSSRGQVTWAAVGRWLQAALDARKKSEIWLHLAKDFVQFLKDKKLNSEVFTAADVSAATLMLPTMERWRSSFSIFWSGAEDECKRFLKPRTSDLAFHTEGGMLWQYRYGVVDHAPPKTYVGMGLRFPDQSEWFCDLDLPDHPHLIVMLLSDYGDLVTKNSLPEGWLEHEEGYVVARGIHTFSLAPDRRIGELQGWAKSVMREAEHILANSTLR